MDTLSLGGRIAHLNGSIPVLFYGFYARLILRTGQEIRVQSDIVYPLMAVGCHQLRLIGQSGKQLPGLLAVPPDLGFQFIQ